MSEYPSRHSHFAHRFCRLLTKAAVAQDIGPEACWLLTIIAHQEDAKRYRGPVLYWNDQLSPLCGIGGRRRLVATRKRAVDAGWLHYEEGGKARAGKYWVTIPSKYAALDDGPCDEPKEMCRSELSSETELNSERQVNCNGAPFLPSPIPDKSARKKFKPPTVDEVLAYCRERDNAVDPQRFVDYYTANGWKVGKNPMRDWKAAVRTWERNGIEARNANGHAKPSRQIAADPIIEV